MPTFYTWLSQQTMRTDLIGQFANYAIKDRVFPRHARRLHIFLLRYEHMPVQRAGLKLAHAEWRRLKLQRRAA